MSRSKKTILVEGARQNTLKNVTVRLPIGELTVVTGVSGSGKSSFAFDTVYAEGQRRYVETFSPYARQFLERMDRPRVDRVEGIPPAIAIDQTNPVRTSRSTVGTMTELADHLKLLYARAARLFCGGCGREVSRDSPETIADTVMVAQEPGTLRGPVAADLHRAPSGPRDGGPPLRATPRCPRYVPRADPGQFHAGGDRGASCAPGLHAGAAGGGGGARGDPGPGAPDAGESRPPRRRARGRAAGRRREGGARPGRRPTGARARRGASRRTCTARTATATTRTRRRTSSPSIRRSAPARPAGASAARSASTCAS